MTFSFSRLLAAAALLLATLPVPFRSAAQAKPAPPPSSNPTAPATEPATRPSGKVIYSRSTDEDGKTTTTAVPAIQMAAAPSVEDADRQAISFTDFDMDVRLHSADQQIAVRALVTVRNTGKTALPKIPLQISSTLNWDRILVAGHDLSFPVATLNSDVDHTGQLHEAAVPLAEPLAPNGTVQLDVTYSGAIPVSAQRLLTLGTPSDAATHSDWDEVSSAFTGLRGFGNVVWYPVSSVPVILGDGARLFDEIGTHKLHLSGATFRLRLTVEFPHGQPPTIALINGQPCPLTVTDAAALNADVPGVATCASAPLPLSFDAPSLFVAVRKLHPAANVIGFTVPENEVAVQSWMASATAVTPFIERWLGPHPHSQLTLLDLPDPDDAPFETGAMMAISLHETTAQQQQSVLAHALTHAFLNAPANPTPAWLSEGAAFFMGTLWAEKQQGRPQALAMLEGGRSALALAEPASPGEAAGQPLDSAISPAYYRTKAAYIFWMLRDLAGDEALAAALRADNSAATSADTSASARFRSLLRKGDGHRDLSWFFADWIDADKGLSDLTIEKAFPNAVQSGNWLVSFTVSNAGYAAAEVPVSVRSATNTTSERVLIPARGTITHRLLLQGQPTEIQVNDGTVPETQASVHITHLDQPADQPPVSAPPPQ